MPRFEYQFDTRIDDHGRRFKRRLRLVILFLLISVVTAGIIYWIIPKDEKKNATENNGVIELTDKGTESKQLSAPETAGKSQSAENAATPSDNNAAEGQGAAQVDNAAESSETQKETTEENTKENAPTTEPQKGKAWGGDPANDVPAAVDNKNSDSKFDELKQLAEKQDWHLLALKAVEIMNSENEGSTNYRIASKYLLKAREGELASNRGVQGMSIRYVVRGGDSLSRIARRNKTTVAGLMRYNRLENGLIRIGRKFIIHPGPWEIEISKSNRLLKLYNVSGKRTLFAVFEVGVGRFNSTPEGGFVISSRIKSPRWYTSDGRVFEPGEPGNELGNYFLKLASTGNPDRPYAGYGIHGTPDESSVGKSLSHGCVRLRNNDVELLYNLVPERTPVTINE